MPDRKSIVTLALLSILGLLGNVFKFEMFFNVDFLFGSIFAVLAVQLFGSAGVVVAFVASLYTYVLWNHPYAIIIFTAEAAFIAALRKKSSNVVALDLLYWVVCGIPLVFLAYYLVMGMELKPVVLIMMKQSVNGIFGALVASVLYDLIKFLRYLSRKEGRISFKHIVFQLITFIILIPMIIYVMVSVRSSMDFTSKNMRSNFSVLMEATRTSVDSYIDDTMLKIEYLEKEAISHKDDIPGLERELRDILNANREFISIGVLGSALEGLVNADFFSGHITLDRGTGLAHIVPKGVVWRTGDVYVSDIQGFQGKRLIYIIKPVFSSPGHIDRFVYGALNFEVVSGFISKMSRGTAMIFSLYDRKGDLIMCTDEDSRCIKSAAARTEGNVVELMDDGIAIWAPKPSDNVSVMTRWKQSAYTKSTRLSDVMPFSLVADMPLEKYVHYMGVLGNRALMLIFFVGMGTVTLAFFVSSGITRQISLLSVQSQNLPEKISSGQSPVWPDTSLEEAQSLKDSFIDMSRQLNEKFLELRKQKERLNLILDTVPLMIILKDTDNNLISANRLAQETLGFNVGESRQSVRSIYPDNAEEFYEKDLRVIASGEGIYNDIVRYWTKEGAEITGRVNRVPVFSSDGEVDGILVVIEDISEEIAASDERQKLLSIMNHQSKMAEMGAMINTIVHQWKQPLNVITLVGVSLQEELEKENSDKEGMLEDIGMLKENTEFLHQTITDFTGFFRKNKERTLFKVSGVMKEVYALVEKDFVRHGIKVEFDEQGDFETVNLRSEFKQVVLNLLNNAKDALKSSGVKDKVIKVSFERHEEFGKVIFKDNGGGIDPLLLPGKLFEPYVSTKGTSGSGIGLYVSRSIVKENMYGTLSASNEGSGARFDITIPYAVDEKAPS